MRATNAQKLQHGRLSLKDGATADGSNLNRWHRNGDLEVTTHTEMIVSTNWLSGRYECSSNLLLHNSDAVAALDVLGRVLTSGKEKRRNDVGRVRIEATNAACDSATNEVLAGVEFDQ